MVNRIDYQQPNDNVGAQNMMVKESLLGDGVAAILVSGNPNGIVNGVRGQLAIDIVSTVVWQNTDDGTTWLVFGGGGPGSTDQGFVYTATGAEGDTFVVMLPAVRASANYVVCALMGTNVSGIAPLNTETKLDDRFTLVCTAAPDLNDTIDIIVKDIS